VIGRLGEVVIDCHDPAKLAEFWQHVLGGYVVRQSHEWVALEPGHGVTVSFQLVPEDKTVKNRVHLDVYAAAIDDLTTLGAEVVLPAEESGFSWTVMRDPEGNEFCAFLRDELPDYRIHGVVIDSADPERIATWWGDVLGAEVSDNAEHGGGWWTLLGATPDPVLTWDFVPVPEPKTVKNRLHWDLRGNVDDFLERGATHRWERPGWTALADPEGNEFCVLPEE